MAITSALCKTGKLAFLRGRHLAANTYNIALYKESASLNSASTRYLTANEITGTGYSAAGKALTGYAATINGASAILDFDDIKWTASTFSTRGCVLYNASSASKEIVAVFDFGSVKQVSNGTFTIQFPTPAAGSAVLEIA